MRVVFMGTSKFAVPTLTALSQEHEVMAVVTQPDRPSGRGRHTGQSPVKLEANRLSIPVYQPERVREETFMRQLADLEPIDAIVVAAFGQIIPKTILDMPRLGSINVHASLLPKYRGAAPIQYAILQGESKSGVTTMLMDPGLDTGPILLQEETDIGSDETAGELEDRLSEMGARLLLRTLDGLEAGTIKPTDQDASQATLAPSIKREQGEIDWNLPAGGIVNKIRAFTPRPGAFTRVGNRFVRLWRARAVTDNVQGNPGTIKEITYDAVVVACRQGAVHLIEVQPENRKRMTAVEFARGARLNPGSKL